MLCNIYTLKPRYSEHFRQTLFLHYIKCKMLSKSSKWELGFVHYIAKFTILRFIISRFELFETIIIHRWHHIYFQNFQHPPLLYIFDVLSFLNSSFCVFSTENYTTSFLKTSYNKIKIPKKKYWVRVESMYKNFWSKNLFDAI